MMLAVRELTDLMCKYPWFLFVGLEGNRDVKIIVYTSYKPKAGDVPETFVGHPVELRVIGKMRAAV